MGRLDNLLGEAKGAAYGSPKFPRSDSVIASCSHDWHPQLLSIDHVVTQTESLEQIMWKAEHQ
jgi:hypothetical protein